MSENKESGKFQGKSQSGKTTGKFRGKSQSGKTTGKFQGKDQTGKATGKFQGKSHSGKTAGKFQEKDQSGKVPAKSPKDATAFLQKKLVKKIVYFYYFLGNDATARDIINNVGAEFNEAADIWPQLNLVEVVMKVDSLIFQDAKEVFVDPLDLEYFKEHEITSMFQVSFDVNDIEMVRKVMKNIMTGAGGRLCTDSDDFEPFYTADNIETLSVS